MAAENAANPMPPTIAGFKPALNPINPPVAKPASVWFFQSFFPRY